MVFKFLIKKTFNLFVTFFNELFFYMVKNTQFNFFFSLSGMFKVQNYLKTLFSTFEFFF